MPPADECLRSADPQCLRIDDRLIMHFEFVVLNGTAWLALKLVRCACCQSHFRIEEAVAVSPGRLGAVKRKVRHLHQTVSAHRVLGRERNANARGDVYFITIDIKRLRDDIVNTVSKSTGCSALVIVTVLNNCKLV